MDDWASWWNIELAPRALKHRFTPLAQSNKPLGSSQSFHRWELPACLLLELMLGGSLDWELSPWVGIVLLSATSAACGVMEGINGSWPKDSTGVTSDYRGRWLLELGRMTVITNTCPQHLPTPPRLQVSNYPLLYSVFLHRENK